MQSISILLKRVLIVVALLIVIGGVSWSIILLYDGYGLLTEPVTVEVIEPLDQEWKSIVKEALNSKNSIRKKEKNIITYRNPFKKPNSIEEKNSLAEDYQEDYKRKTLFIVGILAGDVPFAILKDIDGKTFICKKNDTLYNQQVIKVETDLVMLQDKIGSYVLTSK